MCSVTYGNGLRTETVKRCVFIGCTAGFGGLGYHYPTKSFSECPKVFSCLYEKKDKRPSLSEILDGLKGRVFNDNGQVLGVEDHAQTNDVGDDCYVYSCY